METTDLQGILKQFNYYKSLGDKTFEQLNNEELHWKHNSYSNNIAIIVKHLVGNMLSRWTNFLTEDGEKKWRQRDSEFEDTYKTKKELIQNWEKGWTCLFEAITPLTTNDLNSVIYIRNQGQSVTDAIHRQLAHYAYHIGQLVFIGTLVKNNEWKSLSIPKNQSSKFNTDKFGKGKHHGHFTDDLL